MGLREEIDKLSRELEKKKHEYTMSFLTPEQRKGVEATGKFAAECGRRLARSFDRKLFEACVEANRESK